MEMMDANINRQLQVEIVTHLLEHQDQLDPCASIADVIASVALKQGTSHNAALAHITHNSDIREGS
jgi:hypothetical protein